MFIIDFSSPDDHIKALLKNRNNPQWMVPVFDFIQAWMDGADTFPVKTSGSTGIPKVISHTRTAMIASAARTCDFFGLVQGDTALLALPATHIGGKMMIVRSLVQRLRLICIEPKSDPLTALEYEGRIEFASFTPMQMSMVLGNAASAEKLTRISQIILGGGEVPLSLREHLQNISPEVYETYGMTETISHIALKKLNGPDRSEHFTLLNGVRIALDERGCLIISVPHLSPADIITNDIVRIIDDKHFLWLGRYDNIINTGGLKVSAEEIERKLQAVIAEPFFITGTADEMLGQQVTLVVETSLSPAEIMERYAEVFRSALGKYEKPRRVIAVGKFRYTENGKIDKVGTMGGGRLGVVKADECEIISIIKIHKI